VSVTTEGTRWRIVVVKRSEPHRMAKRRNSAMKSG
jgi:hypothetical protein